MKVQGTVVVNAPQAQVWQVLIDPVQLCKVIPGCEQARQLNATHYEAVLSVKVQFMTIRSQAKGTLLEADAPRHMMGELVGEPTAMAGAFRARVTIDLAPVNDATSIRYAMDLTPLSRPPLLLGRISTYWRRGRVVISLLLPHSLCAGCPLWVHREIR